MPNYHQIYQTAATDYDLLVGYEDYQHNLITTLQSLTSFTHKRVVEFGAGTGRLTRLLAPYVRHLIAGDNSAHMLNLARQQLAHSTNCQWVVADNRAFPLQSGCADIIIAGWSLGHLVEWAGDQWMLEIGKAVAEMERLVQAGGILIILETMGTGVETAQPPTDGLAMYYQWLEKTHKFNQIVIRTDYHFPSLAEGGRLLEFFFGEALAARFQTAKNLVLPEYTGVWWIQKTNIV